MTYSINSRAAIQARIAEWQRQRHYHDSEHQQPDYLFGIAKARWLSWLRADRSCASECYRCA
jgi:hypothetical protein